MQWWFRTGSRLYVACRPWASRRLRPYRGRYLGDAVLATFDLACECGALDAARRLLEIAETELRAEHSLAADGHVTQDRLVTAYERLWWLRNPSAGRL